MQAFSNGLKLTLSTRPPLTLPPLPMSQAHRGTSGGVGWMKAHLKIFADPGERSDIVRVSFGIVRGRERVSGVNCVYFLEQTVGKRRHLTRRGSRLWRLPQASLVPLRFSSSGSVSAEGNMPINTASVSHSPLIITQTKTQYPLDRIISLSYNQTRLGKPMNCIGKERQ